jgi:hypothetical protein
MIRTLITGLIIFGSVVMNGQAVNFNVNDCSGVSHDLFANLDSGKVVVLTWVMPCTACISPAKDAHAAVKSYSASNPGKVVHWVADDYANSTCATLNTWLQSTAKFTPDLKFSNAAIKMMDYGSNGMPKTVVIGGTNHAVYFNENNTLDVPTLKAGIDSALSANKTPTNVNTTGIEINESQDGSLNVYPGISNGQITITHDYFNDGTIMPEVFNTLGMKFNLTRLESVAGEKIKYKLAGDVDLESGVYYVRLIEPGKSQVVKFVITR